jgi:hypothetical protein
LDLFNHLGFDVSGSDTGLEVDEEVYGARYDVLAGLEQTAHLIDRNLEVYERRAQCIVEDHVCIEGKDLVDVVGSHDPDWLAPEHLPSVHTDFGRIEDPEAHKFELGTFKDASK